MSSKRFKTGMDFVDEHRELLIQQVSSVAPILDSLLDRTLLSNEQCDEILAEKTPAAQMRMLYKFIRGWGNPQKDVFMEILKKQPHLSVLQTSRLHFIDQHRELLIQRVSSVAPILDSLLARTLLSNEQCDEILAEKISSDQMRMLYKFIRAWGNPQKDVFMEILRKEQPYLSVLHTSKHSEGEVKNTIQTVSRSSAHSNTSPLVPASPDQRLLAVRTRFVEGVNNAVIKGLLDDMLEMKVLNDGEVEEVKEGQKVTSDKARCLIDMVRRKGSPASEKLLCKLAERDASLYSALGLHW